MNLNWNFQRGGEDQTKKPSVGTVWIFSGATHYSYHFQTCNQLVLMISNYQANDTIFGRTFWHSNIYPGTHNPTIMQGSCHFITLDISE